MLDVTAEVEKTEKMFWVLAPSFEKYADMAYEVGNSEAAYWFARSPLAAGVDLFVPRAAEKIFGASNIRTIMKTFQHLGVMLISSATERESEYQEKVIRKIAMKPDAFL